ncbi:hypothetical protein MMC11_001939 [Xylographa trunciseda]|nr:hypothetical protein [Xylographa trunciseda]
MDTLPDPSCPSLNHLAANHLPLCIPWVAGAGFLASSFSSGAAPSHNPFAATSAFSPECLAKCKLEFRTADGASGEEYCRIGTSSASQSIEHMDVSVSACIGCDFLGASGSGTYAKNVLQNHDTHKFSIRSTVRAGIITFAPQSAPLLLSSRARSMLRARYADGSDPMEHFTNEFGDYYVAGFVVGAKNVGLLSMEADSARETWSLDIHMTLKILFWSHTWEWKKDGGSSSANGHLTFEGYDSLAGKNTSLKASDHDSAQVMYQVAEVYEGLGESLRARVEDQLEALQLNSNRPSQPLTYVHCHEICHAGLVVEIILQPFTGLRDFLQTLTTR